MSFRTRRRIKQIQENLESHLTASSTINLVKKIIDNKLMEVVWRQVNVYISLISWIICDIFRMFPLRLVWVTAFHIIGVTSGAATIGLIFIYGKQLADGKPIERFGFQLPIVQEDQTLKIAIIIFILGCASAICAYLSEWAVANLVMAYQRECQRRLFKIMTDFETRGWSTLLPGPAKREIMRLHQQTNFMGITAFRLLRTVWPLLMFCAALSSLVATDPILTLVLLPTCLMYGGPLYYVNRNAARMQKEFQEVTPQVKRQISTLAKDIIRSNHSSRNLHTKNIGLILDNSFYQKAGNLFFQKRLLPTKTNLLNTLLLIVGVFVLFVYATVQAEKSDWSWSQFVLYLVALRFTITGLQKVTSTLILVSRFIPDFRDYIEFIWDVQEFRQKRKHLQEHSETAYDKFILRCGGSKIPNSKSRLEIALPGLLWVLSPYPPEIADLEGIAATLERRSPKVYDLINDASFYVFDDVDEEELFEKIRILVNNQGYEYLVSLYKEFGIYGELEVVLSDIANGITPSWDNLSITNRFALSITSILVRNNPLFLSTKSLNKLNQDFLKKFMAKLQNRFVVVVAQDLDFILSPTISNLTTSEVKIVVLNNEDVVLGGGDLEWLIQQQKVIKKLLVLESDSFTLNDLELDDEDF